MNGNLYSEKIQLMGGGGSQVQKINRNRDTCRIQGKVLHVYRSQNFLLTRALLNLLTLSPTALGPIGPRVFKGIQLKA
jgi:hypothetical protein